MGRRPVAPFAVIACTSALRLVSRGRRYGSGRGRDLKKWEGGRLALGQGAEVVERAADAVVERRPGLPAEVDAGAGRIERRALELARTGRRVVRALPVAGQPRHRVVELLHARLDTGADVEDQSAALVGRAHERV